MCQTEDFEMPPAGTRRVPGVLPPLDHAGPVPLNSEAEAGITASPVNCLNSFKIRRSMAGLPLSFVRSSWK